MRLSSSFLHVLCTIALWPQSTPARSLPHFARQISEVTEWINVQTPLAWRAMLRNVGPDGEFSKNVAPGAIIASPSTEGPDYYFQWTRDAALVTKTILHSLLANTTANPDAVNAHMRAYIDNTLVLQATNNPSGGPDTGGLGEPKFLVDSTPFTGSWGRPQPDGPALRALVLTQYANHLLDTTGTDGADYVREKLYSATLPARTAIKADLEYTAHYWHVAGFDLWEEVQGTHFFTLMASRRALLAGAELAKRLGDSGAADYYAQQAGEITASLMSSTFWDNGRSHLLATLNHPRGYSALDCGTLLGSLHGSAGGYGQDAVFPPEDESVLGTLDALVNSMTPLYPINANGEPGVGIGRYPEDVYDGAGTSVGHPWFLCTFASAGVAYSAADAFATRGNITLTDSGRSVTWFKRFWADADKGAVVKAGQGEFDAIVKGMRDWADGQMARAGVHVARNGSMSEQFDRGTGFMRGARDLTWSYAEFLNAAEARAGRGGY